MISFPEHVRVKRFIAKEKFYNQIDYATKKLFQDEIAKITWEYKIAPDTVNLAAKHWPEIEVFRIELKNHEVPLKVLKSIDSAIPYPILFIITKGTVEKAAICYKEQNRKNENFAKVDTYFETEWNDPKLNQIKIDGLDIDTVFENFVRQIAGERLTGKETSPSAEDFSNEAKSRNTLKNAVEEMKERERIQKQIAAIERRIKTEPSIGKKQKLAEERRELVRKLKSLC